MLDSDMTLESITGFQYIILLGNFSILIKSMIPKTFLFLP